MGSMMADLRQALAFARQYRTCPPVSMLHDPAQAGRIEAHLRICPYCRAERTEENLLPWQKLAEVLERDLLQPADPPTPVAPGQIRYLRPELGRFRKGFYYNPPGILVLEKNEGLEDAFRVAQIYHDAALAGPGDLVLDDARTGMGDLFVECWNVYTMKGSYLGPAVGGIGGEALSAAIGMAAAPDAAPPGALASEPMAAHDARTHFRELEVEVGHVFAQAAVSELMAAADGPRLRLAYSSPQGLKEAVRKLAPDIAWPDGPLTPEQSLAMAGFPPERYALAAAAGDRENLPVNIVSIGGGRIRSVTPALAEIIFNRPMEGGLGVGGRVPEAIGLRGHSWVYGVLCKRDEPPLAGQIDWDAKTGQFIARFETTAVGRALPALAVFHFEEDEA
jgi:hypothetical protein